MNKISKNQKGFTLVEVLLIILILVVIGAVGYFVYHNEHSVKPASNTSNASKTSNTSNTSSASNLRTYQDGKVSFKYPDGWQVMSGLDKTATEYVAATSPAFVSQAISTSASELPNPQDTLYLSVTSDESDADCFIATSCTVIAVMPLHNKQIANAELAFVNVIQPNDTDQFSAFEVVANNVKVGDTGVLPMEINDTGLYIFGANNYDGQSGLGGQITDMAAFQANSNFIDTMNLINSVGFN